MKVHLVDGTYELFRAFYGAPSRSAPDGREIGATRQLMRSLLTLLGEPDVTHVGAAFDTVIESFRNELYAGYKTGAGIEPDLFAQFPLAERAAAAMGIAVWGMVEWEADDGIATAAHALAQNAAVEQVVVCSPDKDFAQLVVGNRVILRDRMRRKTIDEDGVREKWGVSPASIPDWLALVGDAADGFPGIPRWGAKSAGAVLARYGHIGEIPDDEALWDIKVRGAKSLAENLREGREDAMLFRKLATLAVDADIECSLSHVEWRGAHKAQLEALCAELGLSESFLAQIPRWRDAD
jgi:5'-3' exonuclease